MIEIPQIDREAVRGADARQLQLTKPTGAFGRLERLGVRLAGIQGTVQPTIDRHAIVVAAGTHGVAVDGVSAFPPSVTSQMVLNYLNGGAGINVIAGLNGSQLVVVDAGVSPELPASSGLIQLGIRPGSGNFAKELAMTAEEAKALVDAGVRQAHRLADEGMQLIALGEMGIGNTTSAAALTAAILGLEPEAVVGPGTGIDGEGLKRKTHSVRIALERHQPDPRDGMALLSAVGGLEIAFLTGCCLGGAQRRMIVVLDGYVSTAAGMVASVMNGLVKDYFVAGHLSPEPGHRRQLDQLGLEPLLDLEMRLGEGSGAAMAIPVVRAAAATLSEMATFAEAGVDDK